MFTLGGEEKTWTVSTVGTSAAVAQPSIVSPVNDATDVGSYTDGVDLIATPYTALNGAGPHQDSDWETYRFKGDLNRALLTDNIQTVTGDQDGKWYGVSVPSSSWRAITYGEGKHVAVANAGDTRVIYSTDDALSWTGTTYAGSNKTWSCVAYGERYVCCGCK